MDDDVKGTPCASNRFVPASALDFSRYAKNLAWLLGVKLQAAQELLSQIYGYEHLHELQQALKSGFPPGPFWDDGPSEDKVETGLRLLAGMPGERSLRPAKVLCAWKRMQGQQPYLGQNEALIVELGLMDSPASHRDCVRRVKKYLEGEYSADAHGYPTGFWSFLVDYEFEYVNDEQRTVRKLLEASGYEDSWDSERNTPTSYMAQMTCSVMSRAVDILGEIGKQIEHEAVDWNFGFENDELGWATLWQNLSYCDQWGDSWQDECADFVFRSGEAGDGGEHDQQAWERRRKFVEWPSEAKLKACGVDLSFKDAVDRVSSWRLGWLMAAVSQWQSSAPRIVRLSGQTAQKNEYGFWVPDPDFAFLVMKKRPQYEYEDSISLMDVMGSLIIERPDGTREIGGIVEGWHFSPAGELYADFEQVDEFLEDEYPEVLKGWQVARQYMTIRGITDMKVWANSEEGCAMTLLAMTLAPEIDNDDTRARFLRLIAECFDQDGGSHTLSEDSYFGDGLPVMNSFYDDKDDLVIDTPGLIVVSVSGLEGVGFSIGEHDGEGRQIMVMGGGRGRETRAMNRRFGPPVTRADSEFDAKRARVRKLLEKVVDPQIDVAVLDLYAADRHKG